MRGHCSVTRAIALCWLPLALVLACAACASTAKLSGTNLGKTAAHDFTLTDGTGTTFSLQQYRGSVVVLTFLYTHCPDVCPAIAGTLATVAHDLGPKVPVAFLAVSVDPANDTPDSVRTFSEQHGLADLGQRWRYGLGTLATLQPIWQTYGIEAIPAPAALTAPGLAAQPPVVDHNAVLYLIDRSGRERTLVEWDVSVTVLEQDLRLLAGS